MTFFKCIHLGDVPSWEIPKLAKTLRNPLTCTMHDNNFWTSFIFSAIRLGSAGDKSETIRTQTHKTVK